MHGLGNDFMIIDAREVKPNLEQNLIKALADRNRGIGFDQLVLICEPISSEANCFLKFWNCDGSISSTCGNASRCVASLIMNQKSTTSTILETEFGLLMCKKNKNGTVSVNMGVPKLGWKDIPLAVECDTLHLPLEGCLLYTSDAADE